DTCCDEVRDVADVATRGERASDLRSDSHRRDRPLHLPVLGLRRRIVVLGPRLGCGELVHVGAASRWDVLIPGVGAECGIDDNLRYLGFAPSGARPPAATP